jgi:hypothetical protein
MRADPYRFFFYSSDRAERPHVHVQRENNVAKFWLDPVILEDGGRFANVDLRRIERLISESAESLLERWNEFFAE